MGSDEARIPIFPLSSIVLFPLVGVPLHIFEPRYRKMTEDALGGDRCIGMVGVRPEHGESMSGDPPLFAVGCAGSIEKSERLPDGRYNIVLHGTRRFRILEEDAPCSERLYRRARVQWLDDTLSAADTEPVAKLRARAVGQLDEILRRQGRPEGVPPDAFTEIDDATLVNSLSNGFHFAARDKQGLLEADGVRARYEQLIGLFDFVLAEANGSRPPNSGALH